MLNVGAAYVAAVLLSTLVLLLLARLRAELVALLVLVALEVPGILTRDEALSGFSNSAVITIIGLFVLSAALERTGVAEQMATLLVRLGGRSEARLVAIVMLAAAMLSLVMNNIAAGAVLLPAVMTAARRVRLSPSKLLMPLAFGASLGGMATIFTTANILVSSTLIANGFVGLGFLDFLPLGSLLIVAGVAYMVLVGRHQLPAADPLGPSARNLVLPDVYQLQERLWEVQITDDSALIGQTLAAAQVGTLGVTIVSIFRGQTAQLTPGPETILRPRDVLLVAGREEQVYQLHGVTIGRETRATGYFANPQVQLAELVVAPRANVLGQTLKEIELRQRYGVTVVAIWHEGKAYRTHVGDLPLSAGDALLAVGPPDRLAQLQANPSFIVVTPLEEGRPYPNAARRRLSIVIAGIVVGLSALGWLPTSIAVLLGIVLLVLAKCLTMDEAMQAIEWKTVFVIAGLLPLNTAMQKTGLAAEIGTLLVQSVAGYGFLPLIGSLFLGTMALTQVLGGQVTSLIMAPIAVAAAAATQIAPESAGIAVAIACSATFLSPLAHPVNLLMMGPGGYSFRDFSRVGLGLTMVCFVVLLAGSVTLLPG